MDESRDDFLACARLALQARGRFTRCHLRGALDYLTPRIRCADRIVNLTAIVDRRSGTAIRRLFQHHR
jgi:hypothetical protein